MKQSLKWNLVKKLIHLNTQRLCHNCLVLKFKNPHVFIMINDYRLQTNLFTLISSLAIKDLLLHWNILLKSFIWSAYGCCRRLLNTVTFRWSYFQNCKHKWFSDSKNEISWVILMIPEAAGIYAPMSPAYTSEKKPGNQRLGPHFWMLSSAYI